MLAVTSKDLSWRRLQIEPTAIFFHAVVTELCTLRFCLVLSSSWKSNRGHVSMVTAVMKAFGEAKHAISLPYALHDAAALVTAFTYSIKGNISSAGREEIFLCFANIECTPSETSSCHNHQWQLTIQISELFVICVKLKQKLFKTNVSEQLTWPWLKLDVGTLNIHFAFTF